MVQAMLQGYSKGLSERGLAPSLVNKVPNLDPDAKFEDYVLECDCTANTLPTKTHEFTSWLLYTHCH